jgi:hypothetical protein
VISPSTAGTTGFRLSAVSVSPFWKYSVDIMVSGPS